MADSMNIFSRMIERSAMPDRAYLDTIRFRRQDLQAGMQPILQMISDPRLIGRIHELYPPEPNARPLGVAP